MKEYRDDNNPLDRSRTGEFHSTVDVEWFDQFNDKPDIYEVYGNAVLENMKAILLSDLVKKINEID